MCAWPEVLLISDVVLMEGAVCAQAARLPVPDNELLRAADLAVIGTVTQGVQKLHGRVSASTVSTVADGGAGEANVPDLTPLRDDGEASWF